MSTKFEKTERIIWSQEECGTGVWPFMWNGDKWLKVKEVRKIAVEAVEVTYIVERVGGLFFLLFLFCLLLSFQGG